MATKNPLEPRLIGLVTTSYPRFPGDYAGLFVAAHAKWLREHGMTIDVVAAGNQPQHDVNRVRHGTNLFYRGGAPDALESNRRTFSEAALFAFRQRRVIQKRAPRWQGAFAHWLVPSGLNLPRALPQVLIAHSGDVHLLSRLGPAAAWPIHKLLNRRARFVFVCHALRHRLLSLAHRRDRASLLARSIVCPMGTPPLGKSNEEREHILYLGRLTKQKGVDVLLHALAKSAHKLIIAGDGPAAAELRALAADLSVNVQFVGRVEGSCKQDLLRRAVVVVVPSRRLGNGRSEGMPTVIGEALAANAPVVASAIGGTTDAPIVTVPPDCVDQLHAAIESTLKTGLQDSARRWCAENTWEAVGKRLHTQLLSARNAR